MNQAPLRAPWLDAIARAFANDAVYFVGGAVRNALMDLPVSDVDLCGKLRPDEMTARCEGSGVEARLRAAHFGTVELHAGGHMAEYTTFRKDSYRGGHQPSAVRFADTVEEDALRRDFSVNALYAPITKPSLVIDLVGGLKHLQERVLHTVTGDPDRVLKDDGLRILRAARFQAELGFTPTDAVLCSAKKHVRLLDAIAAERKRDELTKILQSDHKYPTLARTAPPVSSGLQTLATVGAWERLFPGLVPEDFTALDRAPELDVGGKLALLFDRETPERLLESMTALRFAKRAARDAADALAATQALRGGGKPADALRYGLPALRAAASMLGALAADPETLAAADALIEKTLANTIPENLRQLAVGGSDLKKLCMELHIDQNRIGETLSALWREAVNGETANERGALLARARKHLIDSQNHG